LFAKALIEQGFRSDLLLAKDRLNGNLCRCSAYHRILAAVRRAAAAGKGA
jgi:aerobic-type carbon monoxide dehydrogenase small subunit (CoxS/CutS family)